MTRTAELEFSVQQEPATDTFSFKNVPEEFVIFQREASSDLELAKHSVPKKAPRRREQPEIDDPSVPREIPKPIVIPAPQPEKVPTKPLTPVPQKR